MRQREQSSIPVGRLLAVALVVAGLLVGSASRVGAHTSFESSDPSDGSLVLEPVAQISLHFSGPAAPSGEGFVVRLPTGEVVTPSVVSEDEETTWRLVLPEPILDGVVAVRWEVQAPDAHPIAGSFSFTVDAATAELGQSPLTEPVAPDRSQSADPENAVEPATTVVADVEPGESPTVDEFLAEPDSNSIAVSLLGFVGRLLGLGGTVVAVGLLAFAVLVLGATDPERPGVVRACGFIGALIVLGVLLESVASTVGTDSWSAAIEASRWRWIIESKAGVAVVLRCIGGLALAVGSLAVARPSPVSIGAGLLMGSFAFDGHTAVAGPPVVTGLVAVVHALAGAVWAGGVLGLAAVLTARHRRGAKLDGIRLGVRFSGPAALASAVAGAAGIVLAVIVIDGFEQLVTTPWGRVLIAKVLVVAVAAGLGAYNHFVVLPSVAADASQGPAVSARLRQLVAVEAMVMLLVIVATSVLVAASAIS